MSGGGSGGGAGRRRIPTPMPPPNEQHQYLNRSTPRLIGTDASYRLNASEMQALNAVKGVVPKMDRNGYFFYATATAKKKKISLMQSKPPRVAFVEDVKPARRGGALVAGVAERVVVAPYAGLGGGSVAPAATRFAHESTLMTQRATPPAPRARLHSQLECYQPRYHAIRDRDQDIPRKVQVQSQDYVDYYARGSRAQNKKHLARTENPSSKSHHGLGRDTNVHGSTIQTVR